MSPPDSALVELVRACPLAVDLSPQQVQILAELVELHAFAAQHVLAREGDADDRLIVVVGGTLDVVRHRATPDETVLATLHAGDLAHELGFLDGKPRYASLVGTSAGRVLTLARPKLESLIDREPRVLYAVIRAICRFVHRLQTRLSMEASQLTNYVVKQHGRY